MFQTLIEPGETPEALAARVKRPLCAILRANRLFSTAWLMPGNEVNVPDAEFCVYASFPCPRAYLRAPALHTRAYALRAGETAQMAARATGLAERTVRALMNARGDALPPNAWAALPVAPEGYALITVMPGDTFGKLCGGEDEFKLRALNALWGHVYPGMKLLMPVK